MTSPHAAPPIWVLTDEVAGHASQSIGVAEALGLPFETRALRYRPIAVLPVALGPHSLAGLDGASRALLAPPWPALVIATGRRLAGVARWIKRRARADGTHTRIVQIMDPVRDRDAFDLIAAPRHDASAPRANLIETVGAPNRVTPARLAAEGERWRERLAGLPTPRIALLVGGTTRRRGFAPALAAQLGALSSALARAAAGSLMITTSRRTGEAAADALTAAVTVPAHVHRWGAAPAGAPDANPYFGFLGLCDAAIVTGESVSMCSEACATGKPVYIYAPPAIIKPAFARLHQDLYHAGMARPLDREFGRRVRPLALRAAFGGAGDRGGDPQAGAARPLTAVHRHLSEIYRKLTL